MRNSRVVLLYVTLACVLSACGSKDACDRPQPYVHSKAGEELVIPEGFTPPSQDKQRGIPPVSHERKARTNPCSVGPPDLQVQPPAQVAAEESSAATDAPPTSAAPLNIGPGFDSDDVEATVAAWIESWQRGDAPGYLSFYAQDFEGSDTSLSREDWLRRRQDLLQMTGPADISMKDMEVEELPAGRKMVKFTQEFKSSEGVQAVVKLLEMSREGAAWKIRREKVINVL